MVRFTQFFLPLVVCSLLHAASLPGQRISEPMTVPSADGQSSVSLASRGAGAFAVWTDYRVAGYGGLFGTRLGADGTVLDPMGIVIDESFGQNPAAAWTGSEYAVVGTEFRNPGDPVKRAFLHRLDADGKAIAGRIPLGRIDVPRLAANGSELAIGGQTESGAAISFFRFDGVARGVRPIGNSWSLPIPVADQRDWFAFADGSVCEPKGVNCKLVLEQYAFDAAHAVAKKTTLFDADYDAGTLAATSNGAGRFVIAWTHTETVDREKQQFKRRVFYAVTDRDGNVVAGPIRVERWDVDVNPPVLMWASSPQADDLNVVWDEDHFVVSWRWFDGTGTSAIHAMRIEPDGKRLDTVPLSFAAETSNHIRFGTTPVAVRTDTHLVYAWGTVSKVRDAMVLGVTRSVRGFLELTSDRAPEVLTSSACAQGSVDIAANDNGVFAVWIENDAAYGRLLPFSGRPPERVPLSTSEARTAYAPTVAWGAGVFAAVWHEAELNRSTPIVDRVFLRRYDAAGQPIDDAPVLLAIEGFHNGNFMPHMRIDVGFDGARFFAVWSAVNDGAVHGVRIPPTGKVLDAVPLVLSKPSSVRTGGPKLVWTGNEYVLVFYEDATPLSNGGAPLPVLPHLGRMTRVSAEGKVLDTSYPEIIRVRGDFELYHSAFDTSWNGRELLVTWAWTQHTFQPYDACAFAQRFTQSGAEIDTEPVALPCQGINIGFSQYTYPQTVWDGDRWWLYYSMPGNGGGIFAAPLKGAGIDGTPMRLHDRGGAADAVWTRAGLVFAYSEADENYGRVLGVFLSRVISPRGRAVRR